jgi:hypothetical protein
MSLRGEGVLDVYLAFSIFCIPSGGLFVYFPLHVYVHIRASSPRMNTSAIHNTNHLK